MHPAQQCFRPGNRSRLQIDLRLLVHRELVPFQGKPQILLDGLPLDRSDVDGTLERHIAPAPAFLGLVHRGGRVLDDRLRILAVFGIDADANACRDAKIVLVDGMSLCYRPRYFSRGNSSVFRLAYFREQRDEFIGALAAYRIRAA